MKLINELTQMKLIQSKSNPRNPIQSNSTTIQIAPPLVICNPIHLPIGLAKEETMITKTNIKKRKISGPPRRNKKNDRNCCQPHNPTFTIQVKRKKQNFKNQKIEQEKKKQSSKSQTQNHGCSNTNFTIIPTLMLKLSLYLSALSSATMSLWVQSNRLLPQ